MPVPWEASRFEARTERDAVQATLDHALSIYPLTPLAMECAAENDKENAMAAATLEWLEGHDGMYA